MNNIENRLLSILRPGEMLRFVLRPDNERKVEFSIEGASLSRESSSLLAERLGLALQELRRMGYLFSDRKRASNALGNSNLHKRSWAIWIEVKPTTVSSAPPKLSSLGFGIQSEERQARSGLSLPNLAPTFDSHIIESPAVLIASVPQIELFEIEFTRMDLPTESVNALEEAFRLQVLIQQASPPYNQPNLPQAFLALWLSQRTGWRVTARARVRDANSIPIAPLEMIGRDLFRCECDIITETAGSDVQVPFNLGQAYPRGWAFPPIFPSLDTIGSLAASRMHNSSVPDLPKKGLKIGVAEESDVRLPIQSRDRHTYVVGATGTGKSTLLARMIREDMERGEGVILLDPHGDLYRAAMDAVPKSRKGEVFSLDPTNSKKPPGLNILDMPESPLRRRHAAFVVGELLRFFEESWNMREAGGPTFEMYFRNTLLLMCLQDAERNPKSSTSGEVGEQKLSEERRKAVEESIRGIFDLEPKGVLKGPFVDSIQIPLNLSSFTKVMVDEKFRNALLNRCTEKSVVHFWREIAVKTFGDQSLANYVPYISSKINGLVQTGFVSDLLCADRNDFRIGDRMNRGELVLLNLNKGILGGYESKLLGTILMMEIFAAGLQRSILPESKRRPINVYVDEFQNFVSDNVASMLSEARKFGLRLTLANQTLAQLRANAGRQDLLETVLGNVGNMILFRLGVPDAERLKLFIEPFTRQQMQELPNFHALVRMLTPEGPVRPLIMKTLKS